MTTLALFGSPGWQELLIVAAIALLLFGSRRLPQAAKSIGSAVVEFRKGLRGDTDASTLPQASDTTDRR